MATHKENIGSPEEENMNYIRRVYEEANKRQETLSKINVENHQFYEGYDEDLEKRKNDPNVLRSTVFIQEIKPAIDTRIANIIAKTEEREFPVVIRAKDPNASEQEIRKASRITKDINEQLRDAGYLTDIFQEHILGAELYRSPSTVKFGWEYPADKIATVPKSEISSNVLQAIMDAVMRGLSAKPKVKYIKKYPNGRPFVRWIHPTEFLYQPNVSRFYDDSQYVLEKMYMTYEELIAMAETDGWDVGLIEAHKEELRSSGKTTKSRVVEQANQGSRDEYSSSAFEDGKILVLEAFIVSYDDNGDKVYDRSISIALKYEVLRKRMPFQLIGFPYVPIIANRMPGGIESLSSVDVVKWMQKLYNEVFNTWLDAISYRTFPPFKTGVNNGFVGTPKWEPGAIFRMTDPDSFVPVIPPGHNPAPDLVPVMNALANTIRNVLHSIDLQQGFTSQSQEKATIGKIRFVSAQRRAIPTAKVYGEALVGVADGFLKLNQQYASEPSDYVLDGGYLIDAPTLTTVTDPAGDLQNAWTLYTAALENPLYQSPIGQIKLRRLFANAVSKMAPHDVDNFVPTEEELKKVLGVQAEQQSIQSEEQSMMKQMALSQGQQQPTGEK